MSNSWPYYYYPYYPMYPYYSFYPQHYPYQSNKQEDNRQVEDNSEQNSLDEKERTNHQSFDEITEHVYKIYEMISKIETDYQEIREEYKQIKADLEKIDPVHVENVNYKIQDLNVQDLSGNLLVGLTSLSDAENLKRLLADEDGLTINDMNTEEFEEPVEWDEQTEQEDYNEEGGNG